MTADPKPRPKLTHVGGDEWRLEEDYTVQDGIVEICVPEGFIFDLASIPRVLWSVLPPWSLSIAAPLVHDYLYWHCGDPPAGSVIPRRRYLKPEADRLFHDLMLEEGVSRSRAFVAWLAVRMFGVYRCEKWLELEGGKQ